jgi:hypothetical protein
MLAISVSSAWNSTCGKGSVQLLDQLAAFLLEAFLEAFHHLLAGGVLPGDEHGILVALGLEHLAQGMGGLPVGERGTEEVGRAGGAGHGAGAAVGVDPQRAGFLEHLGHAHHHAGMHGADDDIDLVALHQLVDVLRRLGRIGFVIDGDEFDFAPGQLAAALFHRQLEAVGDGHAELGEGTGVGQHQADLELALRSLKRWILPVAVLGSSADELDPARILVGRQLGP